MKRWSDEFENDMRKMGVTGWRNITTDRDAWKFILKKAKVMHLQDEGAQLCRFLPAFLSEEGYTGTF